MPRLILINGAPGSGKSTLARRYADEHPLTLNLDVDVVRGLLGAWLDQPTDAGRLARRLALAMARTHLEQGCDVVVPQFLGRLEFLDALDALAAEVGAAFVEVALLSDAADVTRRFAERSARRETNQHRDASALLNRSGGPATLLEFHDQLRAVVAARPRTRSVRSVDGRLEQTYRDLLSAIDR
ncbi:MAG: AAA family ATPase [bacterium]